MPSDRVTAIILSSTEYDIYTTRRLEHELSALAPGQSIVDFRNVHYLDSTALTVFIRTLKRLREHDPNSVISLINVGPTVRKVFEITRLDTIFSIT